jgi:hypothetical protein
VAEVGCAAALAIAFTGFTKGNVMKLARPRFATTYGRAGVTLAAFGAAAAVLAGSLAGGAPAEAAASAQPSSNHASSTHATSTHATSTHAGRVRLAAASPVMVTCSDKDQVRPSSFILSCADANWSLTGLHWQTWGSTGYATGTTVMNDCVPNCALGKFYYFPSSVVVWRPEALPKHHGVQYFSRVSWVYTGKHCMPGGPKGKVTCLPVTGTFGLWSHI